MDSEYARRMKLFHSQDRCVICGIRHQSGYVVCEKHMGQWRAARKAAKDAGSTLEDASIWNQNHPDADQHPLSTASRIDADCPRCEKNPRMDDDYLCRACRYGV